MESRSCCEEEEMRELTRVYGGIKKASGSVAGVTGHTFNFWLISVSDCNSFVLRFSLCIVSR